MIKGHNESRDVFNSWGCSDQGHNNITPDSLQSIRLSTRYLPVLFIQIYSSHPTHLLLQLGKILLCYQVQIPCSSLVWPGLAVSLPGGWVQESKHMQLVLLTHGFFFNLNTESHYLQNAYYRIYTSDNIVSTQPLLPVISLSYLLGEPAFLLVVRIPIHSCPQSANNCPTLCQFSHPFTPHRSSYNIYIDDINNISRPRLTHQHPPPTITLAPELPAFSISFINTTLAFSLFQTTLKVNTYFFSRKFAGQTRNFCQLTGNQIKSIMYRKEWKFTSRYQFFNARS